MRRGAFTVLETLIAATLGVVVLGGVLGLVSALWTSYHRADERHSPREEAHLAFLTIRQSLGDAVFYQVEDGGACVTFKTPGATGKLSLDASGHRLLWRAPGQAGDQALVGAGVQAFKVEVRRRGVVRLTLVLARPPAPGKLQQLGALTMVDEVTMPCIARRDSRFPWHCPVERAAGAP